MTILAKLAKISGTEITIEEIARWNKAKEYPVSLIKIELSDSGVSDNSQEIAEAIDTLESQIDRSLSALDAGSSENLTHTIRQIYTWIKNTRIAQTSPLKGVVSKYTEQEKRLEVLGKRAKARTEELKEAEYKKTERDLLNEINIAIESCGYNISPAVFEGFIQRKRSTNCLTSKRKASAITRREFEKLLEDAIAPIKEEEAKRKEEEAKAAQKEQQHNLFSELLESKSTTEDLEGLNLQVEALFPLIISFAKNRIDSKLQKIARDAQVAAMQEQKAKEEAAAIIAKQKQMKDDAEEARKKKDEEFSIQESLHPKAEQEQQEAIVYRQEVSPSFDNPPEIKTDEEQQETMEESVDATTAGGTYFLSARDLEPLTYMEFKAISEGEAKKMILAAVEAHLSMASLSKK